MHHFAEQAVEALPAARSCPFSPPDSYRRRRETEPVKRVVLPTGRKPWAATRNEDDDHRLTDGSAFLDKPGEDGLWSQEEAPLPFALNLDLHDEYFAVCENGLKRWNRILEDRGIVTWEAPRHHWLPIAEDLAFVRSVMQPVYERGKTASWVAPSVNGISGKPFDYQYVRLV
ncbi:hypothetical protein ACFVIL_42580 [Streptomyces sp. NPDC127159]|uniref:hypothetical protein n=1 Tax=unclassified Streptomyces TaxID=2593676 RepID=UPI00362CD2DA